MQSLRSRRKMASEVVRHGYKNVIKCSGGNSEDTYHRLVKFWLANYCWKHNVQFYTEATLVRGRCDFFIADWMVIIEVLHTEDVNDFMKKEYGVPTIPLLSTVSRDVVEELMSELDVCGGSNAPQMRKIYISKIIKHSLSG